MSAAKKILGPLVFEVKVHLSNAKDGLDGEASYQFPVGRIPDRKAVLRAIGKTLQAVNDAGLQLMPPDAFFNGVVVKKATGRTGKFAVPAEFEYDADGLARLAAEAVSSEATTDHAEEE